MARWKFRGLPMNLVPYSSTYETPIPDPLWCISGTYVGEGCREGGVLEWCYDEEDANELLAEMKKDPRFSELTAHVWESSWEDEEQSL